MILSAKLISTDPDKFSGKSDGFERLTSDFVPVTLLVKKKVFLNPLTWLETSSNKINSPKLKALKSSLSTDLTVNWKLEWFLWYGLVGMPVIDKISSGLYAIPLLIRKALN